MSQQLIGVGTTPNDKTGDPARTAFQKTNANFTELYNSAPFNVKNYGAVCDGVTDDTTAFQSAITAAQAVFGLVFVPPSAVCLTGEVAAVSPVRIGGGGTLKLKSQPISTSGVLSLAGAGSVVDGLTIDCNGFEDHGIFVTGADCLLRNVTVQNLTGANVGGSTGGITVQGARCRIVSPTFHSVLVGTQANQSIPRCLTFNNGADGSSCIGLVGDNVNVIAVVAAPRISIFDTSVEVAVNDGFYCVGGSDNVLIDGARLHNVANMAVFEAANPTIRNVTHVIDTPVALGGVNLDFGPSNVLIEQVRIYAPTIPVSLLSSRTDTTTVTGVMVRNCTYIGSQDAAANGAPIVLQNGTVNGLRVYGCTFDVHVTVPPSGEGRFVTHATGDSVDYRDNLFRLIDDEGTLTSANIYRVTFPTISAISFWMNNALVTDPAHAAQCIVATAVGNFLYVTDDVNQIQSGAGYHREVGFNGNVALRRVASTSPPSAGIWSRGDVVWATTPNAGGIAGWQCVVAGTPGTWVPIAVSVAVQTLVDAATIVVNASSGSICEVTLGGNRTLGAATGMYIGQRLQFVIIQDGTGGRTLNVVTNYPKLSWSDTGNTLGKRSTIAAIWDGSNWNQDGAQTPYV